MPKKGRRPWFRKGHRMWVFTESDGVRTPLGVRDPNDRAAAERHWKRVLADRAAREAGAPAKPSPMPSPLPAGGESPPTVASAAAAFLGHANRRHAAGKLAPATVTVYAAAMGQLVAALGPRPLDRLTAEELERWADRPEWSPSFQNQRLGIVLGMLKHAGVKLRVCRPPVESRGAEAVIDADQFARVLAAVNPRRGRAGDLAELLTLLWETGARPGEGSHLRVEQVDWANGVARLKHHKTRRKTGRERLLVFNAAAMRVLEGQRERHGSGWLFRTRAGRPYDRLCLVARMLAVSERVGFKVTAYGIGRHSFATRALAAGVPDAVVAALLGHVSTAMVHAHYSHLGAMSRVLKEAAEKAGGTRPAA